MASVLRVGVGSPAEPYSMVWRFWSTRSDVYIAARTLAGVAKLSLHESGVWASAFTTESGVTLDSGDRRHATWRRPPPNPTDGWTRGPAVVIPRIDGRETITPELDTTKVGHWVPAPPPGHSVDLNVLFAPESDADPTQLGAPSESIAGFLDLDDGQRVWVVALQTQLTQEQISPMRQIRDDFKAGITGSVRDLTAASIVWITTSPDGPPLAVEIVLGPNNFYVENALAE